MIDPTKITKYDQTQRELEETILFWVCASGKNGVTSAKCLDKLLSSWKATAEMVVANPSPFDIIRCIHHNADLANEMKMCGIGCNKNKSKTFFHLAWNFLNLKTCSVEDLESIPGIGPKTSRCFVIHSRRDQQYAGLDRHILSFLKDKGHNVPKATPTGKKYRELELIFLAYVAESGMTVSSFDLMIWNDYRNRKAA